jgi:hypothetical protein
MMLLPFIPEIRALVVNPTRILWVNHIYDSIIKRTLEIKLNPRYWGKIRAGGDSY